MNNCSNFIYSACPGPVRLRNIQKTCGIGTFWAEVCRKPQGMDGKGDDVNGNPIAGAH